MSKLVIGLVAIGLALVGCATTDEDEETAPVASVQNDKDLSEESNGFTCSCPAGQQLSGGLCYPACASGYTGVGPVCWSTCASGFYDTGMFCQRDSHIISANNSHCPWYDKCGIGLKKGCSTCPAGYSNDGCTCRIDAYIYAKSSYGRGAGAALSCN